MISKLVLAQALLSTVLAAPAAVSTPFGLAVINSPNTDLNGLAVYGKSDGSLWLGRLRGNETAQELGLMNFDTSVASLDDKSVLHVGLDGSLRLSDRVDESPFAVNQESLLTAEDSTVASACPIEGELQVFWGEPFCPGGVDFTLEAVQTSDRQTAAGTDKLKQNFCCIKDLLPCPGDCCPCGGCPRANTCSCPKEKLCDLCGLKDCIGCPKDLLCDVCGLKDCIGCPKEKLCHLCGLKDCLCPLKNGCHHREHEPCTCSDEERRLRDAERHLRDGERHFREEEERRFREEEERRFREEEERRIREAERFREEERRRHEEEKRRCAENRRREEERRARDDRRRPVPVYVPVRNN